MNQSDDLAVWARLMSDRYGLGDVEQLAVEGAGMTAEERAEWLVIWERLAFLEAWHWVPLHLRDT